MKHANKIWFNGQIIPWNDAKVHPMAHSLHYGSGAFEGIRCYDTPKGRGIFRLGAHVDRWIYSAKAIHMELPWTKEELTQAIIDTVAANPELKSCYIRPILYYGFKKIGVSPIGSPVEGAIGLFDMGTYLSDDPITVVVSDYIRIHPKTSRTEAKICGHYVNSMLANRQAIDKGYTEALMLDYEGYVAEGSAENFFIVNGNTITTPPLGTILDGITRKTAIELARHLGYEVKEEKIKLEDAFAADECFFTGTAAEVMPIKSINDQLKNEYGPVSKALKEMFGKVTKGEVAEFEGWLTVVE